MDPACPGAHRRNGCRGREPEVVVSVEVHRHVGTDPLRRFADELRHRLGGGDPERVYDDDLARTGLDRRNVDALVEIRLRARRVDAEERGDDAVLGGEAHRIADPAEHRLPVDADRVQLQVGDRRLDHRGRHAELDEGLEIRPNRAREAPDLCAQPRVGDELHRVPVVLGHAREARLDAVDAELVEQPRDLELLLRIQHDSDRLLAVAQRRVVQADGATEAVGVVQRSRPDLAQQRTTPSGNADSFSSPSCVTRKLSSTRRPPPPSQYTPGSTASTIPSSNEPPAAWCGYGGS